MPRIDFRNGKYRVRVCQKGQDISHSFHDKETAELWGWYKESLLNEIEAFNPNSKELVSFRDAIDLKIRQALKESLSDRSVIDLQALHVVFAKFKDRLINEITYDELVLFCKEYLSTPLTKGGRQKNGTGRLIMPSKMTLLSKLRRLSSIYSNLIDNGIPVENIAIKVGAWLNGQKSE